MKLRIMQKNHRDVLVPNVGGAYLDCRGRLSVDYIDALNRGAQLVFDARYISTIEVILEPTDAT